MTAPARDSGPQKGLFEKRQKASVSGTCSNNGSPVLRAAPIGRVHPYVMAAAPQADFDLPEGMPSQESAVRNMPSSSKPCRAHVRVSTDVYFADHRAKKHVPGRAATELHIYPRTREARLFTTEEVLTPDTD